MTRVVFIISLPLANGLVFNLAVQANGDTFPKRVTALRSFTVRHGDRLDLNTFFETLDSDQLLPFKSSQGPCRLLMSLRVSGTGLILHVF